MLKLYLFKYVNSNLITNKLKNCIVKCIHTSSNTCCVVDIKLRIKLDDDKFYGDYILINDNKEDIITIETIIRVLYKNKINIKSFIYYW